MTTVDVAQVRAEAVSGGPGNVAVAQVLAEAVFVNNAKAVWASQVLVEVLTINAIYVLTWNGKRITS